MSEETKVATETASEETTKENTTEQTDHSALIAESKKYRKRAQDAEARLAEYDKKFAKQEENKLKELLKSVSEKKKQLKTEIPIAVKISPDINENQIDLISEILLENEISAIIISNTSESSRETLQNIQRHQKGGLSGKPIEKKSNLLISKFYKLIKGKIKIIGVGGVDSGKAAYDKFLLGADYVQLYTGMVFQGPNIAGMIKKDLKELLIRDGVKNFTEIVGNKTVS